MRLAITIFGTPFRARDRDRLFTAVVGDLEGPQAFAHILSGVQHNTEKAGALLAADGIFAVVCTFAIDHGWPKALALPAILLLLAGALLAMSILRSTAAPFSRDDASQARIAFDLLASRMIRFNIALYMTFLSIILLGAAAVSYAF